MTLPADLKMERRGADFIAYARSAGLANEPWAELARVGPDRFPAYADFPPQYQAGIAATAAVPADAVFFEAMRASVGPIELAAPPSAATFVRGDGNDDGTIDLSDAIAIFSHLFLGAADPTCPDAADANDSGVVDISDGIFLLGSLYLGTAPPPAPGTTTCGLDPTEDALLECSYPPELCGQ